MTLEKMSLRRRRGLVAALSAFADAAGEPAEAAWSLGWTTENPLRSLRGPATDRSGA